MTFARGDAQGPDSGQEWLSTDIYFNVLALRVDSDSDASDWSGFRPLSLPNAVRPAGMNMINVPVTYSDAAMIDGLEDAGMPFRVLTNQEYIYLFRQARKGSLLVNRLRLVRETIAENQDEPIFTLQPAWEVRFQRSGKPDTPAGARDTQGYLSPERTPFYEPAIELFMVGALADGNFDVQFLPRAEGTLLNCVVFVNNAKTNAVDVYELPLDGSGQFILTGKDMKTGTLGPDFSFDMRDAGGAPLQLQGAPSAAFYLKQERMRGANDSAYTVKRSGRLLLASQSALSSNKPVLASVDFAVGADGTLAQPAPTLSAAPVGTANYTMAFGPGAYVGIPAWSPQDRYSVDLWIHPTSATVPLQQILGADDASASGPYLRLVDGSALEAGFVGKNGKPLAARTAQGSVRQRAWTRVQLSFDAALPGKFLFKLNGFEVACSLDGEGDHPGGTVNAVSAKAGGFIGWIDQVALYDAGQWASPAMAEFAFDTIDYLDGDQPFDPPRTPNKANPQKPGLVYGGHLIPSTSPAAVASGTLSWDSRGLSIYSAYFDDIESYGALHSSPCLLPGSDGLMHCYFRGANDTFSVMQLDTETARAVYEGAWSTGGDQPETGRLQFVATQAGAFMNAAKVTVAAAAAGPAGMFCDLTMVSPSGTTETWKGVPRALQAFCAVLAGGASNDPADARVQNGAVGYYDNTGARNSAWLALPGNPARTALGFVSRSRARLPLASVEILADGELCDVTVGFAPPRWAGQAVSARWSKVPTAVGRFLDVFGGRATGAGIEGGMDVASYSLDAISDLVAAHRVVLFVRPAAGALAAIEVADGSDQNHANVTIRLGDMTATWKQVPRAQLVFASVLEGDATPAEYDYEQASGDYKAIGANLIVANDGAAAQVANASLGGASPPLPDDGMLVAASLFAAFATGAYGIQERVPSSGGKLAASAFQGATDSGTGKVVQAGSALFRAMPFSLPTQGRAALVADTESSNDNIAPLTLQGFNGGWLDVPDQRSLRYAWTDYVGFETDEAKAPAIGKLTIAGDMSLELWCRPERAADSLMQPFQRLLTFNRAPAGSTDRVRYMAGLQDAPSLQCGAETIVRTSVNIDSELTYSTWFNPQAGTGAVTGAIGAICTLGVATPVLTMRADQGALSVVFGLDATQAPIKSALALANGSWHQLVVGVQVKAKPNPKDPFKTDYSFDTGLYVDGKLQGKAVYTVTRSVDNPVNLGAFVLGDISGGAATLPMLVNETAFFTRVLTLDEIEEHAEQRVAGNAAGLAVKWMFIEGSGNRAVNSAATGSAYDTSISPQGTWSQSGLYSRPILGYGNNVAVLAQDPVIHGWSHLALVRQAGHGIRLRGRDFADAGADNSLSLGDNFSVEAWTQVDRIGGAAPQTLLAKGREYVLSLDAGGQARFSVRVSIGSQQQTLSVVAPTALGVGQAAYLAAHFEVKTVSVGAAGQGQEVRYEAHLGLFVNGRRVAAGIFDGDGKTYTKYKDAVQRVYSTAPLNLGRSPESLGSNYLVGTLADVRLWSRVLDDAEIASVYASKRAPLNANGLVSWWRFDEQSGRIAFDAKADNDARLSNGNLRCLFAPIAVCAFYVNGKLASPQFIDGADAVGGYGGDTDQFLFAQVNGALPTGFHGQLGEVRIWDAQRTAEQITDAMYSRLSGAEQHLSGYWNFVSGSGLVVQDRTGRGNSGLLQGDPLPQWLPSTAPLSNEAPQVLNILGGLQTYAQHDISERPAVVEYADLQRDAYGDTISVMKRAYVSVHEGRISMVTGFKVGDLDTVYLGQAQSKPTLVGYVEGAPPLPSENQTMPYWLGGYGETNTYAGAAEVGFSEADNVVYAYNAARDVADTHSFSMKGGLYGAGQYATSAGIGFEVETPVMVFEGHLGAQGGFELTDHNSNGIGIQAGLTTTYATGLKPGGAWEPGTDPRAWVNPEVGRRYVPNNNGLALVKSLTMDVYASILRSTGTMVRISMTPNPDIPEDVNLIDFPIDPAYIKNGTLDGKVGLRNDPDYPQADLQRGSYFKPLEAYALKRRIERQQSALEAYYQQYDASTTSTKLKSSSSYENYRNTIRADNGYDWAAHLSKRSIVNTYVWTAGGGSFAEQSQTMNVYSEQHGAISSTQWSLGAVGDIQMAFPVVGFYLDFDYLYSSATEVNVVKSKEEGDSFELAAAAAPESYLYAPRIDGAEVGFGALPAEGKVDAYRYMAFMLAPATDNGAAFFQTVVDRNWLANSKDASAAALREASFGQTGPWRVLYRVTHVSRIPPAFQAVPVESQTPPLEPPANLAYNTLLVQLVRGRIAGSAPDTLQIGTAIGAVLGTPEAPGLLKDSLPWWPQFLKDSTDYALPAASTLRQLREDLLQYMIACYASEQGA